MSGRSKSGLCNSPFGGAQPKDEGDLKVSLSNLWTDAGAMGVCQNASGMRWLVIHYAG
jgi:hypothetical protein